MPEPIRIATRQSPLALWQANAVRDRLLESDPSQPVELLPMTTRADRWLETPLSKIGGKSLFVKELEQALFEGRADLAVHSMKDVTAVLPEGLVISTVMQREDPFDAFVSNKYTGFEQLPQGAIVGTCSPRRLTQLLAKRPDLTIRDLRGNVNTRLAKLDAGEFDAIILACAGLRRLAFDERIKQTLDTELCLPAVGQGIIGIETRSGDAAIQKRLESLHDNDSATRLSAERAYSRALNGGCSAPIAGFSTLAGDRLKMTARVISMDGRILLEASGERARGEAESLGESLAKELCAQGAQKVLDDAARAAAAAIELMPHEVELAARRNNSGAKSE
ncbi:MAG: hydroxymethylbilane synthase [Granulosicoccus sp.]